MNSPIPAVLTIFRRLVRRKTSWKLYLLLALSLLILIGCNQDTTSPHTSADMSDSTKVAKQVSTPVRSLPPTPAKSSVLILYDTAGPWGYVGKEHAMLLENLLGHFNVTIRAQPVTLYTPGQVNQFSATFYLGTTYDEPSFYPEGSQPRARYSAFLNDVINTSSTVVWMNHNLWQLAWNWPVESGLDDFSSRFGFKYNGLVNLKYNRVVYRGTELGKAVVAFANPGAVLDGCIAEASGQYACAPELNKVKVVDDSRVTIHAQAYSTIQAEAGYTPYIVQSGKFWYVGDLPFLYHSVTDRYLAFADLLHDMLGQPATSEAPTALLRIDQIHPRSDREKLSAVLEYLDAEEIPYTAAVTPIYVNNDATDNELFLADSEILPLLLAHHRKGNMSVVAHGLTHQWEGGDNPDSGATGDDFEFYRVSSNDDLSLNYLSQVLDARDSGLRTGERLAQAKAMLNANGLSPFAWKAPYDMAGETDYLIGQEHFPVYFGRLHYYSPQGPEGRYVGQMFPWLIERDRYDYRIVPENLGGIHSDVKTGYETSDSQTILDKADHLAVVRGHLASFSFDISEPISELKAVVSGLKKRGYEFENACVFGYRCTIDRTSGRYLRIDVNGGGQSADASIDSSNVVLASSNGKASQSWSATEFEDGSMQLKSPVTGKCLSVDSTHTAGLAVVQTRCVADDSAQRWKQYGGEIRNRATGQCLEAHFSSNTVASGLCSNHAAQQWQTRWELVE